MEPTVEQLKVALKACIDAMNKAHDIGCVDHLDCADDAGKFWHRAISNAKKLLK